MKEEVFSDALLRQFLLGRVTDEERQRIESLFLTDAIAKETIIAAEQELIDAYLENALTTADREQFQLHYGQTPEQQRRLRIARSIKEWAGTETAVRQTARVKNFSWTSVGKRLRVKAALIPSIALAALILIVAAVWLSGLIGQRNRRLAVEQELAQLNSPSALSQTSSDILSLDLSPVTVRSAERQAEITPRADTRMVELRLPWVQKERYPSYEAEIQLPGKGELWSVRNLQAATDRGYLIRMRLPTNMLSPGQYRIRLTGITPDGASGITEEYTFAVAD